MSEFDPTPYFSIANLDTPSLVALGTALLTATPRPLPDELRPAVRALRSTLFELQAVFSAQPTPSAEGHVRRKADAALDNAWNALHKRLSAWAQLPDSAHPEAKEAAGAVAALFADGLTFLTLPYEAEWGESDRRLRMLQGAFRKSVVELAGQPFVLEIEATHKAFGDALGLTKRPSIYPQSPTVREPYLALRKAIASYARKVVGLVDEDNAASVAMAETALAAIIKMRPVRRESLAPPTSIAPPAAPSSPSIVPPNERQP